MLFYNILPPQSWNFLLKHGFMYLCIILYLYFKQLLLSSYYMLWQSIHGQESGSHLDVILVCANVLADYKLLGIYIGYRSPLV